MTAAREREGAIYGFCKGHVNHISAGGVLCGLAQNTLHARCTLFQHGGKEALDVMNG